LGPIVSSAESEEVSALREVLTQWARAQENVPPAIRKVTGEVLAGLLLSRLGTLTALEVAERAARLIRDVMHEERGPIPVRLVAVGKEER
jgi:hypothetical protein